MQQIHLRHNLVGVEKLKKQNKGPTGGLLVMPDSEEYLGIVRYVGKGASPDLVVGAKVYFSTKFQQVRMGGSEICVMEDSQVLAIVQD